MSTRACKPERWGEADFARDAQQVARSLLGATLVRVCDDGERLAGTIIETEAYLGGDDLASHSAGGRRTARNESMFGPGGLAYVYFVYGMHHCFNVVTGRAGEGQAVLIRALEPTEGIDRMRAHRGGRGDRELCSGPAKLCKALGLTRQHDGVDLRESSTLFVVSGGPIADEAVGRSARIGVDYAGGWAAAELRFFVLNHPHLSRREPVSHA